MTTLNRLRINGETYQLGGSGSGGDVELDTTLTQSGKAADAKATGDEIAKKANTSAIPTSLKNPYQLNFTGAVTATYDGSNAVTVNIPDGGAGLMTVNADGSITPTQIRALADGQYWFATAYKQDTYMSGTSLVGTTNTLLVGYVIKIGNTLYCQATGYGVNFASGNGVTVNDHAESGVRITNWPTVSGTLPIVTTADAGKLLMVNDNGAWAATTVTNAEEVAY